MRKYQNSFVAFLLKAVVLAGLMFPSALMHAANIFWTGPNFTYTHAPNDPSADMLTTNHTGADFANNVFLTRGAYYPLYNAAAESGWNASVSPANTLWAVASGDLTNAASLTYDTFANIVGQPGNSPGGKVGTTFYVKIVSDNIYLSLQLTAWGNNDGGSFSYIRSTPAITTTAISLTNPIAGTVFAAPASLKLAASVGATVTNVQFFANSNSLGSVAVAPFKITTGGLAAGSYYLAAVATAAGITATSTLVNVTVVNPVPVTISGTQVRSGQFSFKYAANPGLSYFIQSSSNLLNWTALVTNVASASPAPFSILFDTARTKFFRVARLPNP